MTTFDQHPTARRARSAKRQATIARRQQDFIDDLTWMVDAGELCRENLADRLGTTLDRLERQVHRLGIGEMWARTYSYNRAMKDDSQPSPWTTFGTRR